MKKYFSSILLLLSLAGYTQKKERYYNQVSNDSVWHVHEERVLLATGVAGMDADSARYVADHGVWDETKTIVVPMALPLGILFGEEHTRHIRHYSSGERIPEIGHRLLNTTKGKGFILNKFFFVAILIFTIVTFGVFYSMKDKVKEKKKVDVLSTVAFWILFSFAITLGNLSYFSVNTQETLPWMYHISVFIFVLLISVYLPIRAVRINNK
jgi:hypothetical protein